MKQFLIYLLIMFFPTYLLCLDYVESSNGLSIPQLEGGRTELEFADINSDGDVNILSIGELL